MVDISGREFRKMRMSSGYSIREFAVKVGYTDAYVSMLERNKAPITQQVRDKFVKFYSNSNNRKVI